LDEIAGPRFQFNEHLWEGNVKEAYSCIANGMARNSNAKQAFRLTWATAASNNGALADID
jgi:hypothetical protein